MPAGTIVQSGSLVSPGGQQGLPGSNVPSANSGNLLTEGTDNLLYLPDSAIARHNYLGTDSTNNGAYVVTVDSSFALVAGVTVTVVITNACGANPTLNVNNTGAKGIYNRAGVQVGANELPGNSHYFTVVYNGASWVLITPIAKIGWNTNVSNPSYECGGYDSVSIGLQIASTGPTMGITIAHIGFGVPLCVDLMNSTAAQIQYFVNWTPPAGTTGYQTYWVNNTGSGTAGLVRIDSGAGAIYVAANTHFFLVGMAYTSGLLLFR